MTELPTEIINHILSFREPHPVARAFMEGIIPNLKYTYELCYGDYKGLPECLSNMWVGGMGCSRYAGNICFKEELVCSGHTMIINDYEIIFQYLEDNVWEYL